MRTWTSCPTSPTRKWRSSSTPMPGTSIGSSAACCRFGTTDALLRHGLLAKIPSYDDFVVNFRAGGAAGAHDGAVRGSVTARRPLGRRGRS